MPERLADVTVRRDDPATAPRRIPRRYADPACWLLAEAVDQALDSVAGLRERVLHDRETVGVVTVSPVGTRHTLRIVAEETGRAAVSPTRFAAASPGTLTGIVCAWLGLSGPGAMVTAAPPAGLPLAEVVAADWLDGPARHVLLLTYTVAGTHEAGCRVLGRAA
nr:beta-ketoacyl synthase N-terminal-like domain-containing protein [uncultured Actinoplanes sp.]